MFLIGTLAPRSLSQAPVLLGSIVKSFLFVYEFRWQVISVFTLSDCKANLARSNLSGQKKKFVYITRASRKGKTLLELLKACESIHCVIIILLVSHACVVTTNRTLASQPFFFFAHLLFSSRRRCPAPTPFSPQPCIGQRASEALAVYVLSWKQELHILHM